jgi:[ribosomal protein S18]-alanine N-acetyltransferase
VPAVVAIERAAFVAGWPPTAFEKELATNAMARYLLLERVGGMARAEAIGFAGLWLMVDQAHIVTVAVHPDERRRNYGSLLVHAMLLLARESGMDEATLEVRQSNDAARALYRRYGFHEVGSRKRYYPDNGEDAVIMTTPSLTSARYEELLAQLKTGHEVAFAAELGTCLDLETYGVNRDEAQVATLLGPRGELS